MPSRSPAYLLAAAALAACASSGTTTATPTRVTMPQSAIGSAGNDLTLNPDAPTDAPVAASVSKVWTALPAIYDSLQVPITTLDPNAHVIGTRDGKFLRKLGGERLSYWITCGTRGFGTDVADEGGGVVLTVLTTATPAGDSSTVRTLVEGNARMQGAASSVTRCTTTGRLESRIADMVRARAK